MHVFFDLDYKLRLRVETEDLKTGEKSTWYGETRLMNNAFLLGPWLTSIFLLLGFSVNGSIAVGLLFFLFWGARWEISQIPVSFANLFRYLYHQTNTFLNTNFSFDWLNFNESLLLSLLLIQIILCTLLRKLFLAVERKKFFFIFPVVLDAIVLYLFSLGTQWEGLGFSWWQLFALSIPYRFFLLSFLIAQPFKEKFANLVTSRISYLGILAPIMIMAFQAWDWVESALGVSLATSVFRLKVLATAFVFSFVCGNYLIALFLSLSFLIVHLQLSSLTDAAILLAFYCDGLFLGWILSPYKWRRPFINPMIDLNRLTLLIFFTWVLGFFFVAVGAPLVFAWVFVLVVLWLFIQIQSSENSRMQNA